MIKIKIINKIIIRLINWYMGNADITFITKTELRSLKLSVDQFKKEYQAGLQTINKLKDELDTAYRDREHYRTKFLNGSISGLYDAIEYKNKYLNVVKTHNILVERINKLGGEQFLNLAERGELKRTSTQFSRDDISELIKLCHPDKHNGSRSATVITQKLLNLRKKN